MYTTPHFNPLIENLFKGSICNGYRQEGCCFTLKSEPSWPRHSVSRFILRLLSSYRLLKVIQGIPRLCHEVHVLPVDLGYIDSMGTNPSRVIQVIRIESIRQPMSSNMDAIRSQAVFLKLYGF